MSSKNTRQVRVKPYKGPVGGWGSVKGVTEIRLREAIPLKGSFARWKQNKTARLCLCQLLLWSPSPSQLTSNFARTAPKPRPGK